jgi:hypothetical protein
MALVVERPWVQTHVLQNNKIILEAYLEKLLIFLVCQKMIIVFINKISRLPKLTAVFVKDFFFPILSKAVLKGGMCTSRLLKIK